MATELIKMGGTGRLAVLTVDAPDLAAVLGPEGAALAGLVRERHGDDVAVEIRTEPPAHTGVLVEGLPGTGSAAPSGGPAAGHYPGGGANGAFDVLLLSTWNDVVATPLRQPELDPPASVTPEAFREQLGELIRDAKARLGVHVIVLGACSYDPDDDVHCYRGLGETMTERVHRFNLALVELSVLEGISIVDVDHVLATMGCAQHVVEPLRYSDEANAAIRAELVRVIDDLGFFERRPLVEQTGARR